MAFIADVLAVAIAWRRLRAPWPDWALADAGVRDRLGRGVPDDRVGSRVLELRRRRLQAFLAHLSLEILENPQTLSRGLGSIERVYLRGGQEAVAVVVGLVK